MARYEGNGSWDNLIINIYNLLVSHWVNNADQPSLGHRELDNSLVALPFHFLRAGYYNYDIGNVYFRNSYGYYWNSYIRSKIIASDLRMFATSLYPRNTDNFAHGNSVRCGGKFGDATDSICPKGWEMARYNGDGSWYDLLTKSYGKLNSSSIMGKYNQDLVITPLSFSLTGRMWTDSRLYERTKELTTWIGGIQSGNQAFILASYTGGYFNARYYNSKGFGFSVRWGGKLNFSRRGGFFYDGVKDFVNIEAGFARNGNNIGLFAAKQVYNL